MQLVFISYLTFCVGGVINFNNMCYIFKIKAIKI